jgi:homoserine dehydrogenase
MTQHSFRYTIVGFGNVGSAVARHAAERAERLRKRYGIDLRLVGAVDSTAAAWDERGLDATALAEWRESGRKLREWPGAIRPGDANQLLERGVECVVVALPTNRETGEPGLTWARAAIAAGAHVVLADKGPALLALPELEAEAAARGLRVGASATVGSALPTLTVARREMAGGEIREIAAILNGTTNMILTLMRDEGLSFGEALSRAQAAGVAEPDPSYDVEGWDTAVKLTILSRALLDPSLSLDAVARRGIDEIPDEVAAAAAEGRGRIRLVGRARRDAEGTTLTVAPEVVAEGDPFYLVDGLLKAAKFVSDDFGELAVLGGASGRRDVAAAILKDIIEVTRP